MEAPMTRHPKPQPSVAAAASNPLSAINHVVLLMLENRSFDHMLGYLYADSGNVSAAGHAFEGLTGTESNPDSKRRAVPVSKITAATKNAYFMPGADPGEGYAATNNQLFGNATAPTPPVATNSGFVIDFANTLGRQANNKNGSVLPGTVPANIMGMYTPTMLPILSGLARGYAVCDQWFASAPTETLPNRAFACAATSQGHMDDSTQSYTCATIFGLLSKKNLDWAIYGYSAQPLARLLFSEITNAPETHFGVFSDFQQAAAAGSLPCYAYLEPSWESTGNSQHPNYNVALGEQFIHDVYYALRNGPAWIQTLLIVTYDEHGGCFDHVPPPLGATPPDASAGEFGFNFTRFGVRVPAVLVSPLIPAGSVFRVASGAPLDHTSILKTIERRWQLGPLTARDAAASDVGAVLTLATPRADDPLQGVRVPTATVPPSVAKRPSHLQQVHADLASRLPVVGRTAGKQNALPRMPTNKDYQGYIRRRLAAWMRSK
jgi:phospholipase C